MDHSPEPRREAAHGLGTEMAGAQGRKMTGAQHPNTERGRIAGRARKVVVVVHGIEVAAGTLIGDDVGHRQGAEDPRRQLRPDHGVHCASGSPAKYADV